jgi:hypothetical protein
MLGVLLWLILLVAPYGAPQAGRLGFLNSREAALLKVEDLKREISTIAHTHAANNKFVRVIRHAHKKVTQKASRAPTTAPTSFPTPEATLKPYFQ